MKTDTLNMRLDPYCEELLKRCMQKTKKSKTEITKSALIMYATKTLGLEELMKIRLSQDFGIDVKKIKISE